MNFRRSLKALSSVGGLLLALSTVRCADEPKVRCTVTGGEVIARYQPNGAPTGTCDKVTLPTKGEAFGMASYVPSPSDSNAKDEQNSLAIKASWLGARIADARDNATDATHNPSLQSQKDALTNYPYGADAPPPPPPEGTSTKFPYAFGKFDSVYPDGNNVCTVSKVAPSDLVYPDVPKHQIPDPNAAPDAVDPPWIDEDDQPQTAVKYDWSNVRALVSAESIGTQTFADLTITRDGCTASYHVSLLSPKVGCAGTDAKGNPVADPTLCDPGPTDRNPYGSGIGQGIPTSCENIGDDANPDFECLPTKMAP